MTSPRKPDVPFTFFDGLRTDGYVASRADLNADALEPRPGMFSSEDDEAEVAVGTRRAMHQLLSMNALHAAAHPNQERVQQSTFKQVEHPFDLSLRATSNGLEAMKSVPTSRTERSEAIHLNRLLDDYMLGSKGDRIMKQMEEELTLDEQPIVTTSFESDLHTVQKSVDFPADSKDQIDLDTNLDALLTMDDFTKYISEN